MRKLLLILSVITLLASCAQVDNEHVVVDVPNGRSYRVKRGTITRNEVTNCITFRADVCGDCGEENNITVCGNYTITE